MPRRILIVNHEFPPLEGGGANASFFIGRALARMGIEVEVVTADLGQLPARETMAGVAVRRARGRRRPLGPARLVDLAAFAWSGSREALRAARERRPDAVIAFFGVPGGLAAWPLRSRLGIPLVVSLRGTDVPGNNPETYRWAHLLSGAITRAVWRRADRVTAVSEELRDVAQASAPGIRIDVIPNGVDAERFHPGPGPTSGPGPGGPVRILSVGQTITRKGHGTLLRALPEILRRTGADVRVSIVGRQGPEDESLRALARERDVADRVAFRGPVPKEKMPEAYREADLLVHLSVCEGMSNVVLEGMASGLPVVATAVGGMPALVRSGENGEIVPVNDVPATIEALVRLVGDPGRREAFGRRARACAEALSWDRCARRYAQVVEEVAAAGKGA